MNGILVENGFIECRMELVFELERKCGENHMKFI